MIGVNRSQQYYQPICASEKDMHDITLMSELEDIYATLPFQEYKKEITQDLIDCGHLLNHKRVYRLMQLMGLQVLYPKKNLSKRRLADSVYPHLLKNQPPEKMPDCRCVDVTYIKTSRGHLYLKSLIDVVSRYVVWWFFNLIRDLLPAAFGVK